MNPLKFFFLFLLFFCFLVPGQAQFHPSEDATARMNKLNVVVSPYHQKFLEENFYTTNDQPLTLEDVEHTFQLSARHKILPIYFEINFQPESFVLLEPRMYRIAEEIGLSTSKGIREFTEKENGNMGTESGGKMTGDNYFESISYQYSYLVLYINDENGFYEMVVHFNNDEDVDSEELNADLADLISSFRFALNLGDDTDLVGIGAQINYNSRFEMYQIISVLKGGGADKAGIIPGDLIHLVDGYYVNKKDLSRLVKDIRGDENTKVELEIKRGSFYYKYEIERMPIQLDTDNEFIGYADVDLQKIYFLNFVEYMLLNDLKLDNILDFEHETEVGRKYIFSIKFPMDTEGTITDVKDEEMYEIDYVLSYSEEKDDMIKLLNTYKGYLEKKYNTDYLYLIIAYDETVTLQSAWFEQDGDYLTLEVQETSYGYKLALKFKRPLVFPD